MKFLCTRDPICCGSAIGKSSHWLRATRHNTQNHSPFKVLDLAVPFQLLEICLLCSTCFSLYQNMKGYKSARFAYFSIFYTQFSFPFFHPFRTLSSQPMSSTLAVPALGEYSRRLTVNLEDHHHVTVRPIVKGKKKRSFKSN